MFGRKEKPKRQRPAGSLAQYGIFEVPGNLSDIGAGDDGDDEDLEAELAALTADTNGGGKTKRKAARKPVPTEELDAMVAASMKDINLDDDASDGEDDPDLFNELQMITGESTDSPTKDSPEGEEPIDSPDDSQIIKMLHERLILYQKAESKAKERNEAGKARRYNRGIKTLHELLHDAQSGKSVNEGDIPPVLPPSAIADIVEQPAAPAEETAPAPEDDAGSAIAEETPSEPSATAAVNQEVLDLLTSRQQEYKVAALSSKKSGNMAEAIQFMNIYKQFDNAIRAANEGAVIDPADIPPPPSSLVLTADNTPAPVAKEESEMQQSSSGETPSVAETVAIETKDLGTALKERLEVYRRTKTAAETEGNSSKARRYGRICKQFEDAIKLHARGKPVALDELPVPPGFPPLTTSVSAGVVPEIPREIPPSTPPKPLGPAASPSGNTVPQRPKPPTPPARSGKKPAQKITSRAEKQLQILQQRLHELKQAALSAKQNGEMELARDYLRQAKGILPLIEASKGGLPVDMNSIPLSPLAKKELSAHNLNVPDDDSFTLVSSEDCIEEAEGGTDEQIYENLETQLTKQIKWCLSTRNHCKALGDVPGYNRWERLALGYTRDLDMLRVRKRDMLPPPQHHYETKTYAIVQSFTDLSDNDIEISIIRGVNYPKDADTYVMFEFPYPSDNPPSDRTATVKATSNPEYEAVFPLTGVIDRSSRQCQRAFKRHALKCQVWVKGCSLNPLLCCTNPRGLFRSDTLLGTVTLKLQPLETHCVLHDSFPLMDGRKATGAKLELKLRLRNPILTKQIEQITDKWLTLDQ